MTSDEYVYTNSLHPDLPEDIMSSKLLSYVQDLNNGSYSGGVINIDSSNLSSNNRWIDWRSGYITIPFTVAMKASTDISGASPSGWMAGLLKNGQWNLLNYLSVDFQNTNIIQQTQFLNFFVNYKVTTTWSSDVQKKYGATSGADAIDTASSFYYSAAAGANGNGISNNQITAPTATFATNLEGGNVGLKERLYNQAYSPVSGLNGLPVQGGSTVYNTNVGQNFYTTVNAGAATVYQFHIIATIKLRDVTDFFKRCPLLKKGFFRFTIGYNACQSMSIATTSVGPGASPTMLMAANPTVQGNTNPVMVTSSATNNPLFGPVVAALTNTFTFSSGIGGCQLAGNTLQNPFLTSCRLYVNSYLLTPEYEAKYIEVAQEKQIIFEDVYNYNLIGVAANQQFNSTLSNTIVNAKELVVIPQINSASNGTAQLIPYLSPFDSSPSTVCPLAQIYNYQVILSGDNLWQQAELYDFDQFLSELSSVDALQGGESDMMSSGLIGQREWQFGYRWYVANLGRRLQSLDGVPRSVAISGKNNSNVIMDYFCFITFTKVLKINVVTGEISLGVKA